MPRKRKTDEEIPGEDGSLVGDAIRATGERAAAFADGVSEKVADLGVQFPKAAKRRARAVAEEEVAAGAIPAEVAEPVEPDPASVDAGVRYVEAACKAMDGTADPLPEWERSMWHTTMEAIHRDWLTGGKLPTFILAIGSTAITFIPRSAHLFVRIGKGLREKAAKAKADRDSKREAG